MTAQKYTNWLIHHLISWMRFLIGVFLCFSLCSCFIFPKMQIYFAIHQKDCKKLKNSLIYDLSITELRTSVHICKNNQSYEEAVFLLNYWEKKLVSVSEQQEIWYQKGMIYADHLLQYSQAILELEKFASKNPKAHSVSKKIIEIHIKNKSFAKALKKTKQLLSQPLKKQEILQLEFTKARLLFLLRDKQEALKTFQFIKQKDLQFFRKHHGSFYVALLLEEDQKFKEASKELEKTKWIFFENKKTHWEQREQNQPMRVL